MRGGRIADIEKRENERKREKYEGVQRMCAIIKIDVLASIDGGAHKGECTRV